MILYGYVHRGTFQPFCRSLPEDPLLECFEVTKELNVQGSCFVCVLLTSTLCDCKKCAERLANSF